MIDAIHSNETRTGRSDLSPAHVNRNALAEFCVITWRNVHGARSSPLVNMERPAADSQLSRVTLRRGDAAAQSRIRKELVAHV
jgi:hypothetical protein